MSDWFEQSLLDGKRSEAVTELVGQLAVVQGFLSSDGSTPKLTDVFTSYYNPTSPDPTLQKIKDFFNATDFGSGITDVSFLVENYNGKDQVSSDIFNTSTITNTPFDSIKTLGGKTSSITQIDTSVSSATVELYRINEISVPIIPVLPELPIIDTPNYTTDRFQSNYLATLKAEIINALNAVTTSGPITYFTSYKLISEGLQQVLYDYKRSAAANESKLGSRGFRFQNSSLFRDRQTLTKQLVDFLIANYKKVMPAIFDEIDLMQKNGMSIQQIHTEFTKGLNRIYSEISKTTVSNYKKEIDAIVANYNNKIEIYQLQAQEAKAAINSSVLEVAAELLYIEQGIIAARTESQYEENISKLNQIIEWHNDSFYKNKIKQLSPLIFTALSSVAKTQFDLKKDISKKEKEIQFVETNKEVVQHKLGILKNDILNYKELVATTAIDLDKIKADIDRKLKSIRVSLQAMEGMPYIGEAVNTLSNALSVSDIQLETIKES